LAFQTLINTYPDSMLVRDAILAGVYWERGREQGFPSE